MTSRELVTKYNRIFHTDYTQDTNCVGAWTIEEGTGTTLNDASSLGNDLSGSGDSLVWSSSTPKVYSTWSMDFGGSNDYFSRADDNDFDFAGAFTLACWVDTDGADRDERFMYRYDATSADGYYLGQLPTDAGFYTFVWFVSPTYKILLSNTQPSTGWEHIAGTRSSVGVGLLYVNGVAQTATDTLSGAIDSSGVFYLGCDFQNDKDFAGVLDEPAMFSRDLTSTEINDIMDNGLVGGGAVTVKKRPSHFTMLGVG